MKWVWPWYSWLSFERWSPPIAIDCIWTSGRSVNTNFVQAGSTFGYTLITPSSWHARNWWSTIWTFRLWWIFNFNPSANQRPVRSSQSGPWKLIWKSAWGNSLVGVSLSRPTRFEKDEFDPNRANASIFGTSGSPRLLWDTDRSKILEITFSKIEYMAILCTAMKK